MTNSQVLDSDVLITAKNLYYAFDICPGFWRSLLHFHSTGRVLSIDRVRSELLAGRRTDDLVQWVANDVPATFFLEAEDDGVTAAYEQIMFGSSDIHNIWTMPRRSSRVGRMAGWSRTRESTTRSSSQMNSQLRIQRGRSNFPMCATSSEWRATTSFRCCGR